MLLIDPKSGSSGVFEFCLKWLALLAAENYHAAVDALYHPDEGGWTPELLQTALKKYGSKVSVAGEVYHVTPFETAKGENPHPYFTPHDVLPHLHKETHPRWPIAITWLDPASVKDTETGTVDLQLPLNGEWSGMECEFYIHRLPGGLAFELGHMDVT